MKRSYFPVVLTLLLAVGLGGCDETPTGRSQLALVPGFVMSDMGGDAFEQMRSQLPLSTDAAIKAEVQCVSDALIKSARLVYPKVEMPDDWQVVVFDNPSPNAFALPGGRIGVHSGPLVSCVLGGGHSLSYDVFGSTVNLAARLSTNAIRGQVLMSKDVAALVQMRVGVMAASEVFALQPVAPLDLKGVGRCEVVEAVLK